mgnify:CR=1 FL=1
MKLPLELDWDKPNEKFLEFFNKSNDYAFSVRFWRLSSLRETRFTLTVPFEVFDGCLMMHDVPHWKACAIYAISPMFQQGVKFGNERVMFSPLSIPIEIWLGWFFCTCAVHELPAHPQVLWNHFLSNLHHFPYLSSKKH